MKKANLAVLLFTCVLLLLHIVVQAQTNAAQISGTVKDAKGAGVPNASVHVKGSRAVAVTDAEGHFVIKSINQKKAVLQISSVGFADQEVSATAGEDVAVTLQDNAKKLDEVVVVGYGTAKKKDLSSSISSISSDQMNLGGVTSNAAQAIQGRAAGVQVSQTNSAPGGETVIRIRGGNSIKSTNEPLYVVDGFISSSGKDINPNDIDDIQILKDASATAIYGARGANGVVLITTKRGKTGKPVVQYDGYYGVQKVYNKPTLMNAQDYMKTTNAKAVENGNPPEFSATELASNTNTDWFALATRDAKVQDHNISLSGGSEDSHIALSGNYFSQDGALKKTDFTRYSGRLNFDKSYGKKFKIGGNVYGAHTYSQYKTYDGNIVPSNALYGIYFTSPSIPVYNADGTYATRKGRDNPIAWLLAPTNDRFINRITASFFADYEVLPGLNLHLNAGAENTATKEGTYLPTTLISGSKVKGQASVNDVSGTTTLWEAYANYKAKFAGKHSLSILAGVSRQKDITQIHYTQVQKFPTDEYLYNRLDAAAERIGASSSRVEVPVASFYGRLNYSFADKYLATFSLRADGSSKFGANNRYGYFPAGSLAWRMSDEDFIKHLNLFSTLKVRGSYGITGNDRIPTYIYMATFGPSNVSLGQGSDAYNGTVITRAANPDLQWESTSQLDLGVDMGFAKNKINVTVDYYRKKTSKLLMDLPIGQWWGFSTQTANAGAIENKGLELYVNSENISNKNFRWNTTFNIAWNKQRALNLAASKSIITQTANPDGSVPAADFTKLEVGQELSMLYGYVYDGVIKSGEKYTAQPDSKPGDPKYRDLDGDGLITAKDRQYLGNANPHYVYGLSNDFSYKGIELSIFFQGALDYNLYNMNRLLLETYTGTDALKRWTPQNENTDVPRNGYFTTKYGGYINSRFVENASYLRCKTITLGYNLPLQNTWLGGKIKNIKVYATVQNLFTVTKYTGTDPEVNTNVKYSYNDPQGTSGSGTGNLSSGLDFNAYPPFRSYTFGAKINF
ncbi:SusC/RagA family TonB-linked outer membrane protein [Deminuibacter soli]|uniref:TonB-dependent receptor n=1 Tax=Deminuibacter soli TaxID=2291815 RepID=A0A3E1NHU4_9BACT|nr:TonB-dependent receptor [Deminuibacter soli]RFM27462.1 TonB-dependent receptor [Deminuibacter soli]